MVLLLVGIILASVLRSRSTDDAEGMLVYSLVGLQVNEYLYSYR